MEQLQAKLWIVDGCLLTGWTADRLRRSFGVPTRLSAMHVARAPHEWDARPHRCHPESIR
jgi:hypothetical protein